MDHKLMTVEDHHRAMNCHDMTECALCIVARAEMIERLEETGQWELLWKHYR